MKKAFDQTVREIKREVNKKVLKVPSVEQKILDATSNEPWGPHGSLLADLSQATRNYHEYQIIMGVIWKRINDTGKNWRHVYKALTVLEYLVAHGSERVIDETRERGYQISTLSNFQYIDSSGRDQGNNVRKKSQSIVALVNDKEKIQEVRQKAASNRDKYHNSSMGSRNQPGFYSSSGGYGDRYEDDRYESRYGNRDDDRYGRERDFGNRDDRYSRYADSYGREGDDRYGQNGYRDDDYRGRGQSIDEYDHVSRSRSADLEKDRSFDDSAHYASRGSGAKADDDLQDGSVTHKRLDSTYSEQNPGAPPSYENTVNAARSPAYSERVGESSPASAPKAPPPYTNPATTAAEPPSTTIANEESDAFDEFDPRGSFKATPAIKNDVTPAETKKNLLDTLSESFSSNSLALVPVSMTPEAKDEATFSSGSTFVSTPSISTVTNKPFDDPFGDDPFKAIPSSEYSAQPQQLHNPNSRQIFGEQHPVSKPEGTEFGNVSDNSSYMSSGPSGAPFLANPPSVPLDSSSLSHDVDILAHILPPSAVYTQSHSASPQFDGASTQTDSTSHSMALTLPSQANQPQTSHPVNVQPTYAGFPSQTGYFQTGFPAPLGGQFVPPNSQNLNFYGTHPSPVVSTGPDVAKSALSHAVAPQQLSQDKFETKSSVWADTLSRGLVNLNISGSKTNPLADIGVDFDAINRKEKRMEKPATTTVTSTVTMGKAMGSGSGMGRAGAGSLRPPPNRPISSGTSVNTIGGPGAGYGVNQPMGRGMGIGMNTGFGQGIQMQLPAGFPPGSTVSGGYNHNPMIGMGNYGQHSYGSGR